MISILLVGDPHVTVDGIPDCNRMIDCVLDALRTEQHKAVVFLGDLHHNHALVRIEVMEFWRKSFHRIKEAFPAIAIYALVGNHDRSHDTSLSANALQSYAVEVVSVPTEIIRGVVAAPWYPDFDAFVREVNSFVNGKTLICHQTFDGSRYENGFFAGDGIKPDLIAFDTIISGHIHTPQDFGKISYIGAPRWRIASDANVDRSLRTVRFDEDGNLMETYAHSTAGYCRVLRHYVDTEEVPLENIEQDGVIRIDIHGSAEWVEKRRQQWEAMGARVATFPVVERSVIVRESEGIPAALQKFVKGWEAKYGTSLDTLEKMVAERIHV